MVSPLNILSWNIREASRKNFLEYVKDMCWNHSIDLLFLIEPMSNIDRLLATKLRLGFDFSASCIRGKIWIFWKQKFSCHVVELASRWLFLP